MVTDDETGQFVIHETEVIAIGNSTFSEDYFMVFYDLKDGSTVSSLYCFTDKESATKFVEDKRLPKITPTCTKDSFLLIVLFHLFQTSSYLHKLLLPF